MWLAEVVLHGKEAMCNMSTLSFAAAIRLLYLYVLLQVPKANAFVE